MLLLLALLTVAASLQAADRPNILFIYTDDQAGWELGLSGQPHASTPYMDKLFRRGAYLPHSFTVSPVCTPSRASLITSRHGSELGLTDWLSPKREPYGGLEADTLAWPELVRDAGYATGLVGKWHLGLLDEHHPTRHGYGLFMGFRGGGASAADPVLEKGGQDRQLRGLTADILTDQAMAFLERDRVGPFLLSLHYRVPHTRWLPVAPEDWEPFEGLNPVIPNRDYPYLDAERVRTMTREYLASTRSVDCNLGRLLAKLDQLGLTGSTVIVYTTDHVYNMGHSGVWHKGNGHYVLLRNPPATANIPSGQRPNMWDRSVRVPTAVIWPGKIDAGRVLRETVSNLDWFPTMAAITGAAIPEGAVLRRRDLLPLLTGRAERWDDELYGEYSTHHQSRTHMRMLRTPRWKLVRDFLNPERDEFYDVGADPEETTNLIYHPKSRATIERLHKRLVRRMDAVGDRLANRER